MAIDVVALVWPVFQAAGDSDTRLPAKHGGLLNKEPDEAPMAVCLATVPLAISEANNADTTIIVLFHKETVNTRSYCRLTLLLLVLTSTTSHMLSLGV